MTLHKSAELLSLLLTSPTIVFGTSVVVLWGKEAWKVWKTPKSERTHVDWLILGVAIGFVGSTLDNAYWGIAWSSDLIGSDWKDFWFSSGVYANIPFRQIAGLYSAYCHAKSYEVVSNKDITTLWKISLLLSIIWIVMMLVLK